MAERLLTLQEQKIRDGAGYIKKSHDHLQQDTEMIFRFIKENRSSFPVKKMCHVFNVSPSGYYRWIKAPISTRQVDRDNLKNRIQGLFEQHNGMVGSPVITRQMAQVYPRHSCRWLNLQPADSPFHSRQDLLPTE